jgi:ABC-type proline/glycine betaine transport system permease subunit
MEAKARQPDPLALTILALLLLLALAVSCNTFVAVQELPPGFFEAAWGLVTGLVKDIVSIFGWLVVL